MAKKPNPVIKKAREEGYNDGFIKGQKIGFEHGKYSACMLFASKFDNLDKVPGIGPKIYEKIVNHFGREFFEEQAELERRSENGKQTKS